MTPKDHSSFLWWLGWIVLAITALIGSGSFWTWAIPRTLGDFTNPAVTMLWLIAVFGTWMILLIPFIRAKERVMSHMDEEDEATVSWWLRWMALVVVGLGASCAFWTWVFGTDLWSRDLSGKFGLWVLAVFGSWAAVLIPATAVIRRKLTQARGEARRKKEEEAERSKGIWVEESKRRLDALWADQLKRTPQTLAGAHIVSATLQDGRKIPNVVVSRCKEVVGVHGDGHWPFEVKDIAELEVVPRSELEKLDPEGWFWIDAVPTAR